MPLVSLAGRAGLDLNIGLYYNSLVSTQQDGSIMYDADHGYPGPGFRLGFPTLQPRSYNGDVNLYVYIMQTASGGRVEMRQVGTSSSYESVDGSYIQLVENTDGTRTVSTPDGTQLRFILFPSINEYRCVEI